MKKWMWIFTVIASVGVALLNTACEWSSGGDGNSFNTSRGAGADINFSGTYNGNYSDGTAVQGSSIYRLVMHQNGNQVEITDSNGSTYSGSVGSPGAVNPGASSYSAGAMLAQAQINFKGHNNATDRDVEFAGTIHAVAATDIQGETKVRDTLDSTVNTYTTNNATGNQIQSNLTVTITPSAEITIESVLESTPQGSMQDVSRTLVDGSGVATSTETTFILTEANTMYRLEGSWVEIGGVIAGVDALSSGGNGLISIVNADGAIEASGLEEGDSTLEPPEIPIEGGGDAGGGE